MIYFCLHTHLDSRIFPTVDAFLQTAENLSFSLIESGILTLCAPRRASLALFSPDTESHPVALYRAQLVRDILGENRAAGLCPASEIVLHIN